MAYSIWDYGTASWVSHGQSFPRPGMIEAVRADPTNSVSNCPPDLKGPGGERYGWFREVYVPDEVGADQKLGSSETYGDPDFSDGTVDKSIPAVDLTADEIAARKLSLAEARKAEASEEFNARVSNGFVVGGGRFGMNATAFETLTQAKELLTENPGTPIKAVTSFGSRVDVTSAAQAEAVIAALRAEYNRLVGKEADLYDAIDGYSFSQLQALDVTSDSHWS